jgi:hypothetical protein
MAHRAAVGRRVQVKALREAGMSFREIGRELGISHGVEPAHRLHVDKVECLSGRHRSWSTFFVKMTIPCGTDHGEQSLTG